MPVVDKLDLQDKLKVKLNELGSDFTEAEMLIDFLSVMIENNKTSEYVEEQLKDLLNVNEAKLITTWLFDYLKTAKGRVFERAMDGIQQQPGRRTRDSGRQNSRASDLRSLLNKRDPYSRSNPRQKESPKFVKEIPTNIRCDFFPTCTRPDCQYVHPSEPCEKNMQCTDLKCIYLHDNDATRLKPRQKPQQPCKFGSKCTNQACTYSHPKGLVTVCKFGVQCKNPSCTYSHPSPAAVSASTFCKYYPNCLNAACPYNHPPPIAALNPNGVDVDQNMQSGAEGIEGQQPVQQQMSKEDWAKIPCKFDPNCMRLDCHFYHPSRIVGTSNRMFALDTSNTEGMEVDVGAQ